MESLNAKSQFKFAGIHKSLSSKGPLSKLLQSHPPGDQATKEMTLIGARLHKFYKSYSKLDFEDLNTYTDPKTKDVTYAYVQDIDNIQHAVSISKHELLKGITVTEIIDEKHHQEVMKKYNVKEKQSCIIINGKKYYVVMNIHHYFSV
jgi:hypothetical protein